MDNEKQNLTLFAETFAQLPILGIEYLYYRDLPGLIAQYVNGTTTLDYGCGCGKSTAFFKSLGLDVEGVDINEHMIRFAKEHDVGGKYQVIQSAKVLQKDDYYDLVYAGNVLQFARSKSELLEIVEEIARVLKPDGTFIVAGTNENTYRHKWLHLNTNFEENKSPVSGSVVKVSVYGYNFKTNHYYWTQDDYYDVFAKAGFKIVCIHKPIGNDSDGYSWINEDKIPIGTIYITKKRL